MSEKEGYYCKECFNTCQVAFEASKKPGNISCNRCGNIFEGNVVGLKELIEPTDAEIKSFEQIVKEGNNK